MHPYTVGAYIPLPPYKDDLISSSVDVSVAYYDIVLPVRVTVNEGPRVLYTKKTSPLPAVTNASVIVLPIASNSKTLKAYTTPPLRAEVYVEVVGAKCTSVTTLLVNFKIALLSPD